MTLSIDQCYRPNPAVVARQFDDEMILLPTARGVADLDSVYVLNPTAQQVWSGLDGRRTLGDIADTLVGRYDVGREAARADVLELVEELAATQLIELVPSLKEPP